MLRKASSRPVSVAGLSMVGAAWVMGSPQSHRGSAVSVGGGSVFGNVDDGSVGCGAHVGVGGSESSVDDLQISSDALAALFVVIDDVLMYVSHVVDHLRRP